MVLDGTKPRKSQSELFNRRYILTEDDRFFTARCNFFQFCFQTVRFCALAGYRIKITDLFEPQDQFKDVGDGGGGSHCGEADGPLLLHLRVGLSLGKCQINHGIANEFRWQIL